MLYDKNKINFQVKITCVLTVFVLHMLSRDVNILKETFMKRLEPTSSKNWCYFRVCLSNISEIDECASSPCVYGSCSDEVNQYRCDCYSGYTGILCDEG